MLFTEGLCQTDVVNCLLMVIQHSLQGLHSCMIITDPTDAVLDPKMNLGDSGQGDGCSFFYMSL